MGIPTLIKTLTASNDASLSFVDGTADVTLDSTYDEYMFVCTDINGSADGSTFFFQGNVAGGSGYNETITSTVFTAYHDEADSAAALTYDTGVDQAQGTAFQHLALVGNGADESIAGILHLFSPASTTYVTHFYTNFNTLAADNYSRNYFVAGYFNLTGAIDEIQFKMSSGNFDGVIQMYGIA